MYVLLTLRVFNIPSPLISVVSSSCEVCGCSFTLFNRKHHCRNCGAVVCDTCSRDKLLIAHVDSQKPVRVCTNCSRQSLMAKDRPTSVLMSVTGSTLTKQHSADEAANVTTARHASLIPPSVARARSVPTFVPPTPKPSSPPPPPPPRKKATQLQSSPPHSIPHSDTTDDANILHNTDNTDTTVDSDTARTVDEEVASHPSAQAPPLLFTIGELQAVVRQRRGSLLAQYGIDSTHKEMSLADDDFERVFGCSKLEFQVIFSICYYC